MLCLESWYEGCIVLNFSSKFVNEGNMRSNGTMMNIWSYKNLVQGKVDTVLSGKWPFSFYVSVCAESDTYFMRLLSLHTVSVRALWNRVCHLSVVSLSVVCLLHVRSRKLTHTHNCFMVLLDWVSWHQKGKTRKVKPLWIYWSKI